MRQPVVSLLLMFCMLWTLNAPAEARRHESRLPKVTAGTETFFVQPEAGIRPVIGALEDAKQSIDLVVYLLSDDRIISALKRAKERGVQVRVMVESHPYGGGKGNLKSYEKLKQLGIDVRYTPNRFRFTHQKTFIVDHRKALITTANFTRSAFSKNREYGYFDTVSAEVREIEAMFEADWKDEPFTPRQARLVISPTNSRAKILDLIRSAKKSLWVQAETFSDKEVIAAIAERQAAGVNVMVQVEQDRDLDKVLAAGIHAKKYPGTNLHAKAIVVDGKKAYMGSENFTANSLNNNRELGILLDGPEILNIMSSVMCSDWGE